ncbi:hypothetical protein [Fodinicola feengrottensis]|uniref:ATP synthase subunit I n=1 Tax=Fodinicola feengrottensis TaxID=435914 RepID=A0ABN2IL69_9ACTN|nr:hypothetical protein [Fodinicola feengrottensis]
MNEPTPEEAAAALRSVHEGKERVINSAAGSRWLWIVSGLVIFLYCAVNALFPATQVWLIWVLVAFTVALTLALRTRVGSALLGRPVTVSSRSLPLSFSWRLLRMAPVLGIGIVVALVVLLLHVPYGQIYYGALAGLYIATIGPRFQLWLLRRQGKD